MPNEQNSQSFPADFASSGCSPSPVKGGEFSLPTEPDMECSIENSNNSRAATPNDLPLLNKSFFLLLG
jgi:hypothetical protein